MQQLGTTLKEKNIVGRFFSGKENRKMIGINFRGRIKSRYLHNINAINTGSLFRERKIGIFL